MLIIGIDNVMITKIYVSKPYPAVDPKMTKIGVIIMYKFKVNPTINASENAKMSLWNIINTKNDEIKMSTSNSYVWRHI